MMHCVSLRVWLEPPNLRILVILVIYTPVYRLFFNLLTTIQPTNCITSCKATAEVMPLKPSVGVCLDDGWFKEPHLAESGWTLGLGQAAQQVCIELSVCTGAKVRVNS